jgi:sigma-B regulation protein RsbU (phosphoserine phosphatase)
VFVPIGASEGLGTLALALPAGGALEAGEEEFLRALAGLAATGIGNARAHAQVRQLNTRLDLKVQQLQTLLELIRALTQTQEPGDIAQILGLTLAGQWAASRYAVATWRPGQPPVVRQKNVALEHLTPLARELAALPDAIDVQALPEGRLRAALQAQRLALVFPLRLSSGTVGIAAVGARPGGRPYSTGDLEFGAGLVAQAVVAFENAWQWRELLEKKQIERELALAASIQQTLFPAQLPHLAGCELAAVNRPARLVGGDYYDALTADAARPDERCVLCVADVSGKGLAASLLMSNMQATLRALLGREASLAELARCTNELLYVSTPGNKYVTAILLAVDPVTGACSYVNGGHTQGLLIRAGGRVEMLQATGLALGMFPDVSYEERTFHLNDGDLLALYSDGVTEALDVGEEEFGDERLVASLRRVAGLPARDIVSAVLGDVESFARAAPQYDDITLLVVKRL